MKLLDQISCHELRNRLGHGVKLWEEQRKQFRFFYCSYIWNKERDRNYYRGKGRILHVWMNEKKCSELMGIFRATLARVHTHTVSNANPMCFFS